MNFTKIISIVLISFIVILIVVSYLSSDKPTISDVSNVKENTSNKFDETIDNIKDKNILNTSKSTYENVKHKITYGSFDREIPTEVYFCPEDNCLFNLINLIENSKKTIDCAVYDISLDTITEKLIEKKNQGLEVRFVSDFQNSNNKYSNIGKLKQADISVITNYSENQYMHNKYCVFDEKIVWVGSMNFTLNGTFKNNNNVLVFEDKELANEYTQKIDSFFNGNFSSEKEEDIYVKSFGNIENYFCPENNCDYHILNAINDSNYSLDCMFFSFTLNDFTEIIKDKNITQRYILENKNINEYSQYHNLIDYNIPVILDQNPNNMHNKFCVIDKYMVVTGSTNISKNGMFNNDESLVLVYDQEIAEKYIDYFNNYWEKWNED